MNDWNIQSRARTCQACGRAFDDQEAFHTLLFENRSGLERLDVCGGCWQEQHRHGAADRKGFISHWQGVFAVPPPPPPEPIQRDNAETLLRRLMERNDPVWQPAAFILAVMLERKRILRIREQLRQNGRRTFVYEHPRSGDIFAITDPALQLDQLEKVQHDVAQLLEHGLPPEAQPREEPFVPEMTAAAGAGPGLDAGAAAEAEAGPGSGEVSDSETESDPGVSPGVETAPAPPVAALPG